MNEIPTQDAENTGELRTMSGQGMSPLPKNHPIMLAWDRYKSTDDYANSFRWAGHEEHRAGSMWTAFLAGFNAATPPAQTAPDPIKSKPFADMAEYAAALDGVPQPSSQPRPRTSAESVPRCGAGRASLRPVKFCGNLFCLVVQRLEIP